MMFDNRTLFTLIVTLSFIITGGMGTGCGKNDQQPPANQTESTSDDDKANAEDVVDYGTGKTPIEKKEEMENTLEDARRKKQNQLEEQSSSDK